MFWNQDGDSRSHWPGNWSRFDVDTCRLAQRVAAAGLSNLEAFLVGRGCVFV